MAISRDPNPLTVIYVCLHDKGVKKEQISIKSTQITIKLNADPPGSLAGLSMIQARRIDRSWHEEGLHEKCQLSIYVGYELYTTESRFLVEENRPCGGGRIILDERHNAA
jgi:hypothetical protein